MATLNLSFDTGNVTLARINDALAVAFDYQPTLPNGSANPETKAQFNRRMVNQMLVDLVRQGEAKVAKRAAEAAITPITLT